jgi:tetratricopeptide (TPR) repeat protein
MVEQKKTLTQSPTWLLQFGQRLERARGHMGLTQTDLAGGDLSKSFVSLLETARSYPSVETLLLLAGRAGSSVGAILLDSSDLRQDTALSVLAIARERIYRRPEWSKRLLEVADELLTDLPLWARADVAFLRGLAFAIENRLTEADRLARDARRQAEQARFDPGKARAIALMGHVAFMRRDLPKAVSLFSEAVSTFRTSGSLRSEFGIRTLLWLGTASIQSGRVRFARGLYEKARRLASRLQLQVLEGQAIWGLGHHAWVQGDLAKAVHLMREAKKVFEETEDLIDLGEVMRNLGRVLREQGDLDAARDALQHAVRLADQVGNLRMRSLAHDELAKMWVQRDNLEQADEAAGLAVKLARSAGDRLYWARAVGTQGLVASNRGDQARARRLLGQSARALKRLGAKDSAAEAARDLALLRASASESQADHYLAQALGSRPSRPKTKRPSRRRPARRRQT